MLIEWASEQLDLLAGRAMHWPRQRALIIADPHFGKASTFRAAGVPVPAGTTARQLERLDALLADTSAQQLIILGDFLHGPVDRDDPALDRLTRWRAANAHVSIMLVRGNHDQRAGDPPRELDMTCVDEPYNADGLALCHHPHAAPPDRPALAGHVHPGIVLRDGELASTRVPCFHFHADTALLPAFGAFTGLHIIRPTARDRVYGIVDDAIVELSPLLRRR